MLAPAFSMLLGISLGGFPRIAGGLLACFWDFLRNDIRETGCLTAGNKRSAERAITKDTFPMSQVFPRLSAIAGSGANSQPSSSLPVHFNRGGARALG